MSFTELLVWMLGGVAIVVAIVHWGVERSNERLASLKFQHEHRVIWAATVE